MPWDGENVEHFEFVCRSWVVFADPQLENVGVVGVVTPGWDETVVHQKVCVRPNTIKYRELI